MKKFQLKSFIAGILIAVLVITMINPVFAAQVSKTITAAYNNIKITIDGKQIQPKDANGNIIEPFISDGSTYLPVRAVADAVGYDVAWDGNTNTVNLTKKGTVSSTQYSRINPAPVGTAQTIVTTDYTLTLKINSVLSGDAAWNLIYTENKYNKPAPDNKIYVIANVTATADKVNSDKAVSLSYINFTAFSNSNVQYDLSTVITPKPDFTNKIFEGGTYTGNIVFLIDKADPSPKAVYGMKYDGSGGIWFALPITQNAPPATTQQPTTQPQTTTTAPTTVVPDTSAPTTSTPTTQTQTNKIIYYKDYPTIPDFGAFTGATFLGTTKDDNDVLFVYDMFSFTSESFSQYMNLIKKDFTYVGTSGEHVFYKKDNITVGFMLDVVNKYFTVYITTK